MSRRASKAYRQAFVARQPNYFTQFRPHNELVSRFKNFTPLSLRVYDTYLHCRQRRGAMLIELSLAAFTYQAVSPASAASNDISR